MIEESAGDVRSLPTRDPFRLKTLPGPHPGGGATLTTRGVRFLTKPATSMQIAAHTSPLEGGALASKFKLFKANSFQRSCGCVYFAIEAFLGFYYNVPGGRAANVTQFLRNGARQIGL